MLWSMRKLPSKSCQRWFSTTMLRVLRTNGLWLRTEMPSPEFCKQLHVQVLKYIKYDSWGYIHIYILLFFNLYRFRPRILIDVSKIDMTTTVLGFKISMPIMIAPTAMQKMAHPEGIPCTHTSFFNA